jgi:2-acylglycerol O-acyltransferase 2
LAVSLDPRRWPGLRVHGVCASVLFNMPLWRHFLGWLGCRPATRREFDKLLADKGSVKVNPGACFFAFALSCGRVCVC